MVEKTHNLTELKEFIAESLKRVDRLKLDRADVNDEIASVRAALAARGIPKKAFDMAASYMKMDPDDREGFDVAYALVREAGGLPLQEDLFAAADRKAREKVEQEEWDNAAPKTPDAAEISRVITAQDDEKIKGRKVHEPTGEHKGTIN